MSRTIYIDTGPLGLITQRPGVPDADACRAWVTTRLAAGDRLIVPEVADYELRRELVRARKPIGLRQLDRFITADPERYLPITTAAMRRGAELWADVRNRGRPTADPNELDGDAILAGQVLTSSLAGRNTLVATMNVSHLARFLRAELWSSI